MSTQTLMNEMDFNSPGYEFLRSSQNMTILYHKLVALNYRKEFSSQYKCPPINQYYFSMPNKNHSEQKFLFTCLCAWLIKDKCQMNFDIEPEEYQDIDHTVGIIFEALKLLLTPDDDDGGGGGGGREGPQTKHSSLVDFPPGRLKRGFGPEVIYTLNVLADRALESIIESTPTTGEGDKLRLIYHNKTGTTTTDQRQAANSISIGQPFVGGGLTTRPLGSYQIDDRSLTLGADQDEDEEEEAENGGDKKLKSRSLSSLNDAHGIPESEWFQQVQRVVPALEAANLNTEGSSTFDADLSDYSTVTRDSRESVRDFLDRSRSLLAMISSRIDRHLQVISGREKFLQANVKTQFNEFLEIWCKYSHQLDRNRKLKDQVEAKAERFENHNVQLGRINSNIKSRVRELNDSSKLKEYETMIEQLESESSDLKLRVGLLLAVYAKKHCEET